MVLQQSLADLHRAYRNYFRALKEYKAARARGEKATLKVRKPRFKNRRHDQAAGSPPTAVSGCWATVACPSPRWAT